MRAADFRKLKKLAYGEFKVTRQISTGNGETYLAASDHPPGYFVAVELGYGSSERPCGDCFKGCTLDYTLTNLDEINAHNREILDQRDGETLKAPKKRRSAAESAKRHRAMLRAAGVAVIGGEYVDNRPRTWIPSDPNRQGRRGMKSKVVGKDQYGRELTKLVDERAAGLIESYRSTRKAG